jgi:hypothetical protein
MDGTGEHGLKQSKSGCEIQKSYVLSHMWIIHLKKPAGILLDMGHTLNTKYAWEE